MAVETVDLSSLTFWTSILQEKLEHEDLKVLQIIANDKFVGTNDNVNSDLRKIKIEYQVGGTETEMLEVFVKTPPESSFTGVRGAMSKVVKAFTKETFWYKYAQPYLSKKYPDLSDISPRCYFAASNYESMVDSKSRKWLPMLVWVLTEPKETGILLLDNVSFQAPNSSNEAGMKSIYVMRNKHCILSETQGLTVFKKLAHFHGSWLHWLNTAASDQDQINGLTANQIMTVMKPLPNMANGIMMMLKETVKQMAKLLQIEGKNHELIEKYVNYMKNHAKQDLIKALNHYKSSPLKTMIHGDFWSNNMLFADQDQSVCFVDFQVSSIQHPGLDIWYFLGISTDSQWRDEYLNQMLQVYYETLMTYYKRIPNVSEMSLDEFKKEVFSVRIYDRIC